MTLRLGVAGVQHPHIGMIFDAAQRRPDLLSLVAVAENDTPLRDAYVRRGGPATRAYADYREMLAAERLDVVAVAGVNDERAAMVCAALDAGTHVLADKPLCTTLDDLAVIEAAWHRSGRHLSVLFEKRCWPPTLALRDVLVAGELGDVALAWFSAPHRLHHATRPEWMFQPARYGGLLNDLAIHDIDLLLWLTGAQSGQVQGLTANRAHPDLPDFEDTGQVYLRLDDGILATVEVHWLSPEAAPWHGDYRLVLTGTRGTATVEWVRDAVTVATHDTPPRLLPLPEPHAVVDDFLVAVAGGAEPPIRAWEVFAATRVALMAQTSANSGAWQHWRIPDTE